MLYLAFIWHMHQPYYKDLITQEFCLPWVRLHGVKDYLDMVEVLKDFPAIKQTFNFVPSLIDQIQDYLKPDFKERYYELSVKKADDLSNEEKDFILNNFFMADVERIISMQPRFYELYLKRQSNISFSNQDLLDLVVWFNLAWIDPSFRKSLPELNSLVRKGRFFNEDDKKLVLSKQIDILRDIIPTYKSFIDSGQIEVSISPYYHPILPLLNHTKSALEANIKTTMPKIFFNHPEDVQYHISEAIKLYQQFFGKSPRGMWPSEQAVCRHILPLIAEAGINWIVTDESILFKSLKKQRDMNLLYRPYSIETKCGHLNVIFRDNIISNKIGFVYHHWKTEDAVSDFMHHLEAVSEAFKDNPALVAVALDGENAWEYYPNDGWDFLKLLYKRITEHPKIKTVTVSEYLDMHPDEPRLNKLAAGSWISADFSKWIGNYEKNIAWEYLAKAREELANSPSSPNIEMAWKQIYIAEGSDWFWWYGDDNAQDFDILFRRHLSNFYKLLNKPSPEYLNTPIKKP